MRATPLPRSNRANSCRELVAQELAYRSCRETLVRRFSRLHRCDPRPEPFAGRAARFVVIAAGIGAEPFGARAASYVVGLHVVLRRIAVSIDLRAGTVELAIAAEQHFSRLL